MADASLQRSSAGEAHTQREGAGSALAPAQEPVSAPPSPPSRRHGILYRLGDSRVTACAPCFQARVRCVFEKRSRACVQCTRSGDECVPRVIVRNSETPGSLLRESGRWLPVILAGKGTAIEHFQAVRQLTKLSMALGFERPPRRLHYLSAHLFLAASEAQSVSRLHAATCFAAALGIDSPMEWLEQPPDPADRVTLAHISETVHARVLVAPQAGACFVVRSNAGRNEVLVNSTFEFLFTSASMLINHMHAGQVPMVETWPRWIEDPQDVHDFMCSMVAAMVAGQTVGTAIAQQHQHQHQQQEHERKREEDDGKRSWSCILPRRVVVRDSSKALFEATLSAAGSFGAGGVCYAVGMCFHQLRPLNESAMLRWQAVTHQPAGATTSPCQAAPAQPPAVDTDDDTFAAWLLEITASSPVNTAQAAHNRAPSPRDPGTKQERG